MTLCASTETGIRLEAMDLYFGKSECRSLTFEADVASDTNSEYVDLNVIDGEFNEKLGYAWFNVAGAGVDPAPAGKEFAIEVAYAADATDQERALAFVTAINASSEFLVAAREGNVVDVANKVLGAITAETESASAKAVREVDRIGSGGNLGYTQEGGSELSFETTVTEIRADQTGQALLDEIVTGNDCALSTGFIQITKERLEVLIGEATGDVLLPSGGTSLVGFGESRLFQSLKDLGGTLILHPRRLPLTDKTNDWVIHKSAFKPATINFSGQDVAVLSGEFKGYVDQSISSKVNLVATGDWTQDIQA